MALNRDKALTYLKEYTTNGFNKTQALIKANPKATYRSNEVNANRFHQTVIASDRILKDFKLSDITPEYVLSRLKKEAENAKKSADKREALNLLGKFLALWKERSIQDVSITTKDEQILHKYITINRLEKVM